MDVGAGVGWGPLRPPWLIPADPALVAELVAAAHRLEQVALDLRRLPGTLQAGADVQWRSAAAERFRARLAEETERLAAAARAVDEAADAVTRHAAAVRGGGSW